jgi:hypothetical protein
MAAAPGWPGLFNTAVLHRVASGNEHTLRTASGQTYGLSDCGVACLPPPRVETGRRWCPVCWPDGPHDSGSGCEPRPGPEPDPKPELEPVLPPLPKRGPGFVPPLPQRSSPASGWFTP